MIHSRLLQKKVDICTLNIKLNKIKQMKNLRSIAVAAFLTVGAFSSTVMVSCNPDACKDVVCANGGTCTDGSCTCAVGFEGTNCNTRSTVKFAGSYNCSDVCTTGSGTYSSTMALNSDSSKIIISNPGNLGATTTAYATANVNSLVIPDQSVTGMSLTTVSGSGTKNGNVISGSYTVKVSGTVVDVCTFTWTKL